MDKIFIEKYSSVLNPDYRNDMINFAMANYFLKRKNMKALYPAFPENSNMSFFF
ncbi:MAG: hypothetical protein IPG09_18325 [Ignavibacteria bacterium]|nr:hypothetical protein [Ignavibacteria bacterium]